MPIQRRTVRSGPALAVAFVALSVSGFGPAVQAFAQDAPPPGSTAEQDPPSRVGYVSLIEGTVSMHPNATDPWAPASINYPLVAGTSLWTEPGAKAEIQIGAARVDLDGGTEVDIVAVDDQNIDLNVPQGRADVHLHGRQPNESYEVTVPRGTVALGVDGTYRIIAGDDQAPSRIGALYGSAQLIEPNGTVPVETNNELVVTSGDPLAYTQQALQDDGFDHWVADRMHRFERPAAQTAQYVSPQVVGAENLADYGTWQPSPEYGSVWYPSGVSASWAPYREGHWAWVAPWGWTWVDDAPWGFAPFHYGRWAQFDGRWGWVPGERVARPVYAPAMVTFVGGAPGPGVGIGVSVGIGIGIGAAIGWIPLGPREVYHPPYHVSENYIRNVNVTNVHVTNVNIQNTTNVTYVNQHAVTAVNHDAFVGARPVHQAALPAAQAATFTHPIVASAPSGRPGAAPTALPQPTVASRVGAEAAARPMQAPPQAKLQMPTTHLNAQGHVVPTAVPAPAAAAAARPAPGATPPAAGVPQPHGQAAPAPAVAHPTGAPQPQPLNQPAPHPGAAPGPVPQPNAAAPHAPTPQQPAAVPHPQPQPQAPHPGAAPAPVPQPNAAAPHAPTPPQPAAVPHPQPQPQAQPHPQAQPQAQQPHPQAQPQAHPAPQAQPHPQAQPQAQPHPQAQPQAQPHPQAQPQPQQHPQGQQPHPAPEKKDEHPTSFHQQPASRPAVQPAHAAPRPAPQRQPEHKENKPT